ncbi:MAG: hypothetical protein U0401_08995 [Anaerolineae bacterium]
MKKLFILASKQSVVTILATLAVVVTACGGQPPATAAPATSSQSSAAAPHFSHPTEITNPFYPVSLTEQAIALGTEDGQSARTEVTLLPDSKMITVDGQQIEACVAQFVAYGDGKLVELAYDYLAQADDGSVYYLGEDVSNYEDGQLVNHEGSWLAGKDGAPVAVIMPARPKVGQVFNPENFPGVAYETDEILSLTEKTTTPAGPTDQGLLVKETLMDGSIEHKVYAANFGIVEDRAEDEQVNLVLFQRSDAKPGNVPEPLQTLEAQAEDIMDVAPGGNWQRVAADVAAIIEAGQTYQTGAKKDNVPQPFQEALTVALDRLQKTSAAKDTASVMQAANDLSAAVVDLFTVYRPMPPTDVGWLDVLGRQLVLDVAADDFTAAADSLAKTHAVWARLKPLILAHNGSGVATQFENNLTAQQEALRTKDASTLTTEANNGLELVDALEQLF